LILLWGIPADTPIQQVGNALTRAGEDWLMLDQSDEAQYRFSFEEPDASRGWLSVGDRRIELDAVTSIYPRPYETARVLQASGITGPEVAIHAAQFDDAMLLWLELTSALVVNRPSAMASNGSKPLQSALIADAGFAVPETLLATDAAAAAEFRDRHGKVIYKSISGVRSRVSLLQEETLDRISTAACAIQLQEYVSGKDVRVHVLENEVFASSVESPDVDYRYPAADHEGPTVKACEIPERVAAMCVNLTKMLGLSFAGIDLRLAEDGRWICFEANPSPGYTFYEQHTGAPITEALADLLRRGKLPELPAGHKRSRTLFTHEASARQNPAHSK
jgi:hypothetical protein